MSTIILDDVYKLNPGALVTFIVLDLTSLGGSIYRYHSGANELGANVTWQGVTYAPFPVEFKGITKSTQGKQARPSLTLANVSELLRDPIRTYYDMVGAWVTRKKTLVKYLDAINFSAGNPLADPNAHFPDEKYVINRKVSENKIFVEFELATLWEVYNAILPARRIIANSCVWEYLEAGTCDYDNTVGPWYNTSDVEVFTKAEDRCGKRISSCKLRFAGTDSDPLRFGSFPSAGRF